MEYSISPDNEKYPLPVEKEYAEEKKRLERLVMDKRREGYEIVVVMGLGFVGIVMAGVIADSVDHNTGLPGKFVIGMQRPSTRSYWKIPYINRGLSPVKSEDPEVPKIVERCVKEKGTLIATFAYDALKLADVIVIDVQLDYLKEKLDDMTDGHVDLSALEKSLRVVGLNMPPDALVLIETTVPPGTTEFVALPILKQEFEKRGIASEPLLAHSYERVMPGRHYVDSIRNFWRVCSGVDQVSRRRVEKFLNEVLNTNDYPLMVLDRPMESETAKIIENSYRATILAFMDEWSLFAERNGVDLPKVIQAIKVRPTHNNIIFPGPGIGGYCLPKDGGLGVWAHKNILNGTNDIFKIVPQAININDTRALHAAELTVEALAEMNRKIQGAKVVLLGASYREDVGDTRYSGSELIVRKLIELGADVSVHDPYIDHWYEFESQDTYPYPGYSRARFFKNQEKLKDLRVSKDLEKTLDGAEAVIIAVRHSPYLEIEPQWLIEKTRAPLAVVDCFSILSDDKIKQYLKAGCAVKGLGRGHIDRLKKQVLGEK